MRCSRRTSAGRSPEPPEVALAVEQYRWAWRPPQPRLVLLGESHIYTSAADLELRVQRDRLPAAAQGGPDCFARILYCLGYGEPELLSGRPSVRNAGTRQFWELCGRLVGRGRAPRRREAGLESRLAWKVEVLSLLQARGIWVLDASVHAMYRPGGDRLTARWARSLHQQWWQGYGEPLLATLPGVQIWAIGKTVAGALEAVGVPLAGWIYQPGAGRNRQRDLERGWAELERVARPEAGHE